MILKTDIQKCVEILKFSQLPIYCMLIVSSMMCKRFTLDKQVLQQFVHHTVEVLLLVIE